MERDAAEKDMDDVSDGDEEVPDGDSPLLTRSYQWETTQTDDECEQEDKTAYLKSQDTPNPATPLDSGIGEAEYCRSTEAKEDTKEASEDAEHGDAADHENLHVINQEEDEAAKEQHMNGESGWRNVGRRFKLRSSGSVSEQSSQSAFPSIQKGNVMSSGGRHKQTRRRNHHHHQQNRGRRRTGNQLILALKEMLSESLSFWCISCVHMMIEIIVTLTHNCGVGVETGGMKLYNFGQQLFVKMTDTAGMRTDASRILNWTKCTGTDLMDKIVRSVKWVKTAALICLRLFCALVILSSQWAKGTLVLPTPEPERFLHAGRSAAGVQRHVGRKRQTPQKEEEGPQTLPEVKPGDLSQYQHRNTRPCLCLACHGGTPRSELEEIHKVRSARGGTPDREEGPVD